MMHDFALLAALFSTIVAVMHVLSMPLLVLAYWDNTKSLSYRVKDGQFVVRRAVKTGLLGFITEADDDGGLFWGRIQDQIDSERTNAGAIFAVKQTLVRLRQLPQIDEVKKAISVEEQHLKSLREHDLRVEAICGLTVAAADLTAIADAATATRSTEQEMLQLNS